jgi:hypothetical protein
MSAPACSHIREIKSVKHPKSANAKNASRWVRRGYTSARAKPVEGRGVAIRPPTAMRVNTHAPLASVIASGEPGEVGSTAFPMTPTTSILSSNWTDCELAVA